MTKLKRCPCGKFPEALNLYESGQGGKYQLAQGDCCGNWMVEFRANYKPLDSNECMELAIAEWNSVPRGIDD